MDCGPLGHTAERPWPAGGWGGMVGLVWAPGQFAATLPRGRDAAMQPMPLEPCDKHDFRGAGEACLPHSRVPTCHPQWVAFLFLRTVMVLFTSLLRGGGRGSYRGSPGAAWGHGEELGLRALLPGSRPHRFLLRVALGK